MAVSAKHQKGDDVQLVFGTMTIAGSVDEPHAREQLDTFLQHQPLTGRKRELDTAYLYEEGRTEELVGKIMTDEERSTVFFATKGQ